MGSSSIILYMLLALVALLSVIWTAEWMKGNKKKEDIVRLREQLTRLSLDRQLHRARGHLAALKETDRKITRIQIEIASLERDLKGGL